MERRCRGCNGSCAFAVMACAMLTTLRRLSKELEWSRELELVYNKLRDACVAEIYMRGSHAMNRRYETMAGLMRMIF